MSALSVTRAELDSIDWLVASEFSALLNRQPDVRKVWDFDRKLGFKGWKRLGKSLWEEGYDEVYDLHCTLRTKILKLLFIYWAFSEGKKTRQGASLRMPLWKVISKQRFRLYGYFLFKSLWPKSFRPDSVAKRSSQLVGGSGTEKPNARHLISAEDGQSPQFHSLLTRLKGMSYICVMPGSKWAGKKWPVEFFAELLSDLSQHIPVVMGTPSDTESVELVRLLEQKKVPVVSAVGAWNLREVAQILSGAWRYLGNDTGLGHLAEAVGVPSYVIFGPTHEDMGFGPWRPESRAIGKDLSCRPCGKDGRYCYRVGQRFACLKELRAADVIVQIPEAISGKQGASD